MRHPRPTVAISALVRAGTDMPMRQLAVLASIVQMPGQSTGHIAEFLNVSKPAVTRASDALVDDGYLTRTIARQDRRQVSLVATAPGVELVRVLDGVA